MDGFKCLSVKEWFGDKNNIGTIIAICEVREKAVKVYHQIGRMTKTAWIPKSCLEFGIAYNQYIATNCEDCNTIEEAIQKNITNASYDDIRESQKDVYSLYL